MDPARRRWFQTLFHCTALMCLASAASAAQSQTAVAAPPSLGPMVGDAQTLTLTISLSYEL